MERAYKYLGYFFLLMLPLIAIAFHKSYGSKFPDFQPGYDPFIHVHAVLASTWVLMLIVQPFLIVTKKLQWHRVVGKASYAVFPLLILSFVPGIIKLIQAEDYAFIFFPGGDCLLLIFFYAFAMYHRHAPAKHMRFIIASSLTLLGPTLGRIFPVFFDFSIVGAQTLQYAIQFAILGGLILYDVENRSDFSPYVVSASAFAVAAIVFYSIFL